MKKLLLSAAALAIIFPLPTALHAEEESVFVGSIGVGMVLLDYADNLSPRGSDKRIDSLDSKAKMELNVLPAVLPDIDYHWSGKDGPFVSFYNQSTIEEMGNYSLHFGYFQPLTSGGKIHASLFCSPFEEVWQNPYLTGADRKSTTDYKYGAVLGVKQILGSGLSFNVVYMNNNVDKDELTSLQPDLTRDGSVYGLNGQLIFFYTEKYDLRPNISIVKADLDGESSSYTKAKLTFEARRVIDHLTILPKIYYSHTGYDQVDPIFAETRRTNSYGVAVFLNYAALFDDKHWSLQGLVNYGNGDSNITFYDTESLVTGVFLSYNL